MLTKFYNFNCITLYAYIDIPAAVQLTAEAQLGQPINHLITVPIRLYENPYMAKLFASTSSKKRLVGFSIYVASDILDRLDLELEDNIKKTRKSLDEIKKKVSVVRTLEMYKKDEKGTAKPYIAYDIQNIKAIKQVHPLEQLYP